MPLSATEPLHSGRTRNTRQFKFRKQSLLYESEDVDKKTNKVIHTRIWKHTRSPNGYFLDISKVPQFSQLQHIPLLHEQYDSEHMQVSLILASKGKYYLECYPDLSIVHRFTSEGLSYENTKLVPCKAIEGDGVLVDLYLFELPFIETSTLTAVLQATLQQYGVV